jgi:hypothetical protein
LTGRAADDDVGWRVLRYVFQAGRRAVGGPDDMAAEVKLIGFRSIPLALDGQHGLEPSTIQEATGEASTACKEVDEPVAAH